MDLKYFYAILSGFALVILPTFVSTSIIPATLVTVLTAIGAIIVILFSIVLIVKALVVLFGTRLK